MKIQRLLINLCSSDINKSKNFYTSLFEFKVAYDSDWFVNLVSIESEFEIGLVLKGHEVVPEQARGSMSGAYLTFVVDNVNLVFLKAQELDLHIIQHPEMTGYGQIRMLIKAPEGTVCDVSSPG